MTVSATPPNTSQGWSARYERHLLVGCLRYQRRTAPTRRPFGRRHTPLSRAGACCSVGSQLMGPSRVAAFPLVGFGADVVSGSSPSTIAISSSP